MADGSIAPAGRTCTRCGLWKQLSEFFVNKKRLHHAGGGVFTECRVCVALRVKAKRKENPDGVRRQERESWKRRFHVNGEKKRKRSRLWVLAQMGMTHDDFVKLHEAQNKQCAICCHAVEIVRAGRDNSNAACLDHDHTTGKVRGILCTSCNVSLGRFKDSVEVLESAIRYLKAHKDG